MYMYLYMYMVKSHEMDSLGGCVRNSGGHIITSATVGEMSATVGEMSATVGECLRQWGEMSATVGKLNMV